MEGMTATDHRSCKGAEVPRQQRHVTETFFKVKDAVLLRTHALDDLFHAEGIKTYAAKADALNYPASSLFRAYGGWAVPPALIVAIRRRYPDVPYERLFIAGPAKSQRRVTADAPADLAA